MRKKNFVHVFGLILLSATPTSATWAEDNVCSLSAVSDRAAAEKYVNELADDLYKESKSNQEALEKVLKVMGMNPQDQLNGAYIQSSDPNLDLFVSAQQRLQNLRAKNPGVIVQNYNLPQNPIQASPDFRPLNFNVGLIERMTQRVEQFYQTLGQEMQNVAQRQTSMNMPQTIPNVQAKRWADMDPRFQPQVPIEGYHSAKVNFDSIKNLVTQAADQALGECHEVKLSSEEEQRAYLPSDTLKLQDVRLNQPTSANFALKCGDKRVTFLIYDAALGNRGSLAPSGSGASLTVSTVGIAENDSPLSKIELDDERSALDTTVSMNSAQVVTFRNISSRNNANQFSNNVIVMEKSKNSVSDATDLGAGPLDSVRSNARKPSSQVKQEQNRIFVLKGVDAALPVQSSVYETQRLNQEKLVAINALTAHMQKQRNCGSLSSTNVGQNEAVGSSRWKRKMSAENVFKRQDVIQIHYAAEPTQSSSTQAKGL